MNSINLYPKTHHGLKKLILTQRHKDLGDYICFFKLKAKGKEPKA